MCCDDSQEWTVLVMFALASYFNILTQYCHVISLSTYHSTHYKGKSISLYLWDRGCQVDPRCMQQMPWELILLVVHRLLLLEDAV